MSGHIKLHTTYIGIIQFKSKNETTGQEMKFEGLPGNSMTIHIDNENQVITEEVSNYDLYEYFNLELEPGDNKLVISGVGNMIIRGRYLYNVGA